MQYIRIGNDRNGVGVFRDSKLNVVTFEALAGGKNVATIDQGPKIKTETTETVPWYQVLRPELMFTPGNQPSETEPKFSSWGFYTGPAVITLKAPVALEKIRFLLSNREESWYARWLPFYWQGQLYREGEEAGDAWYQYKVEVSEDGQKWTTVADRTRTEMLYSVPYLVDWDGDGLTDLVLGMMNGQGAWGGDKEYRLYRNTGAKSDPQFSAHQSFLGEDGQPLKLPAYYYSGMQAGVSAPDLNGDGKLDLVVEGYLNSELLHYQNISTDSAGLQFKKVKELGDPQPLDYASRYRFFAVEDVDGDGVADLVNSINTEAGACGPSFFKGTPATAPARTTDLAVTKTSAEGIALQWTKPAGAVRYDLRWSAEEVPTELNWPLLAGVQGEYAADGSMQTAVLTGVSEGRTIWIAIKSLNAAQEVSPISDAVRAAAHPLRLIVLRNGPAATESFPEYSANEGTYLDAQKPAEAAPRERSLLWVRAPVANLGFNRSKEISDQEKVVLVRFKNLPQAGELERAELELSTDPLLQDSPNLLQGVAQLPVSVYAVRGDWDAATATYQQAAPGRDWRQGDLNGSGLFLSKAKPQFTVEQRRRLVWNVTGAVRAARQKGQAEFSLLVRIDYTGKYVSGQGYKFCGPQRPAPEFRPRLTLTVSD